MALGPEFNYVGYLAEEVRFRVGEVGSNDIDVSSPGDRLELIGLSRGGVLIPVLSEDEHYIARRRDHVHLFGEDNEIEGPLKYPDAPELPTPVYIPDLAIVTHFVGQDDEEGLHQCDPRAGTVLDAKESHKYVFRRGETGLWRAYDAFDESASHNGTAILYLDAARPVTVQDELVSIRGLFDVFDRAVLEQKKRAVAEEIGTIPQERFLLG